MKKDTALQHLSDARDALEDLLDHCSAKIDTGGLMDQEPALSQIRAWADGDKLFVQVYPLLFGHMRLLERLERFCEADDLRPDAMFNIASIIEANPLLSEYLNAHPAMTAPFPKAEFGWLSGWDEPAKTQ